MTDQESDRRMKRSLEFSQTRPKSVCICGHSGDGADSEHAGGVINAGHGGCLKCDCKKFSWDRWTASYALYMKGGAH